MKKQNDTIKVEIDSKLAYTFEALLRDGLVASGAVSEADNENIALSPKKIAVELEPEVASKLAELIRSGLVASGAVSEADNENIALTTNPKK